MLDFATLLMQNKRKGRSTELKVIKGHTTIATSGMTCAIPFQESSFVYTQSPNTQPKEVNHDVLFREGCTLAVSGVHWYFFEFV